jgi:hypothetical protein
MTIYSYLTFRLKKPYLIFGHSKKTIQDHIYIYIYIDISGYSETVSQNASVQKYFVPATEIELTTTV